MSQNQYEDLFAKSEDLLQQMTHIMEEPATPPSLKKTPPPKSKKKSNKLSRGERITALFVLLLLLVALALGGGKILQIIGEDDPISPDVEVQSQPQKIEEENSTDPNDEYIDENLARVRVSLDIRVKTNSKVGKIIVQNLPINTARLRFSVIAEGTDEPFFRSEMIAPGYAVYEIPLQHEYLVGKHEGQILLEFYEIEEEKKITESLVDIIFNVSENE
jgi:hypothetical protein